MEDNQSRYARIMKEEMEKNRSRYEREQWDRQRNFDRAIQEKDRRINCVMREIEETKSQKNRLQKEYEKKIQDMNEKFKQESAHDCWKFFK